MTGYNPRRGPNMNQYIASLNSLPASSEPTPTEPGYPNLEDELSLFTNVEFLNEFDIGDSVDGSANGGNGDGSYDEGFNFPYIPSDVAHVPPYPPTATDFVAYGAHVPRPNQFAQQPRTPQNGAVAAPDNKRPAPPSTASSPSEATVPGNGALEASSRAAAEEDKRRRNTAASARFRVKKKQREQALERTAKEMTDRAEKLEARIAELEQENKFLRSLVVEKAGGAPKEPGDVSDVLKKVAADSRKADSAKKGVGTAA